MLAARESIRHSNAARSECIHSRRSIARRPGILENANGSSFRERWQPAVLADGPEVWMRIFCGV